MIKTRNHFKHDHLFRFRDTSVRKSRDIFNLIQDSLGSEVRSNLSKLLHSRFRDLGMCRIIGFKGQIENMKTCKHLFSNISTLKYVQL